MKDKDFEKHKKAVKIDLEVITIYSRYLQGVFHGMLSMNEIILHMTPRQSREIKKIIDNFFEPENFGWFGKRKKVPVSEESRT